MSNTLGIRDVEHYHWQIAEADTVVSWSGNGNPLSLAAAVELACIEAHRGRETSPMMVPPVQITNCPTWSLLKSARWPGRRSRAKLRDGSLAVLVLPADDGSWWNQNLHDLLNELTTNGFPPNLARGLTGAVIEMVDNIWQHSETAQPGLLAYQVRRRKFAFCVADTGIGILASLRTNPLYRRFSSSMEALRSAIQPGVSRFEYGGLGFSELVNALTDLWGSVRVRSGEAGVRIDRTSDVRHRDFAYLPHLPGVHISVRCSLDPPSSHQS